MLKLVVSNKKEDINDAGSSSFINKAGVYDVIMNFASVAKTVNGAYKLNLNIEHNGSSQTFYGPTIQNTDGNPNEIGMRLIHKLSTIAGLESGYELTIETETHKVGKDNKEQDFEVITEFTDMPFKIRVQPEYTRNNKGEIFENMEIRNVFRDDGASADEIASEAEELGKQLALELEKYTDGISMRDGITQEEVDEFIKARKAGKKEKSETAPAASATKEKRAGMFKRK